MGPRFRSPVDVPRPHSDADANDANASDADADDAKGTDANADDAKVATFGRGRSLFDSPNARRHLTLLTPDGI